MQCKHDKELTIDFCILIFLLRRLAILWSGCWCSVFSHVSADMLSILLQISVFIVLSMWQRERGFKRKMCIHLNIGLYLVWMVDCAEESCTCLAVADTAMSRGSLISSVNPAAKGSRGKELLKVQEQADSTLPEIVHQQLPSLIILISWNITFTVKPLLPKQCYNSTVTMRWNPHSSWNL